MCGITGFIDFSRSMTSARMEDVVTRMTGTLAHRGPDDHGCYCDPESGLALGHRRLSIIDLSMDGHQPMRSSSGRYVIIYNGEIYNHLSLRKELEDLGRTFRSHSDTEVMLSAFEQWGVKEALQRFVGMFALALWDAREKVLFLARDRIGEKPLYWGTSGNAIIFGSELKAIKQYPGFDREIDLDAIALYMRYLYIPSPKSIYKTMQKLQPGCYIRINASSMVSLPEPLSYWSAYEIARNGLSNPFIGSAQEAVEFLDMLLRRTVRGQMISDVPLGAFLSGGVDSSAIVAMMQMQSSLPVKTFTIGYAEKSHDEAQYAKQIAAHLGTEHTELFVTERQAMELIPALPRIYDEPFADSSQIPTRLIAQLTRQFVTVGLSGDGGDELFGGYNRYIHAERIWRRCAYIPLPLRKAFASVIDSAPPVFWNRLFPPGIVSLPDEKARKMARLIRCGSRMEIYEALVSCWDSHEHPLRGVNDLPFNPQHSPPDLIHQPMSVSMMYADMVGYLPGDILTKVDRAGMAVSLETRLPFLDHRLVEFAWSLPLDMKIRPGTGKWILRQVLDQYVPEKLVNRPKAGFAAPIDIWLRGALKDWAESLLSEAALKENGLLNPAIVRKKWREHSTGKADWHHPLWGCLMLQAWQEEQKHSA